ncbi:MAG: heterodisulfide reductase-related iron-sulfur binding cluster [Alphaproteobacteria bacterium]
MAREGSLEAPVRHPIGWQDRDFHDRDKLDAELRRVFDICHGCRRCFNLCDSFPRLFDLIDESDTGELDSVDSAGFKRVADACTLCDMCFMTKCPYVPPHEFDVDFPHLMLRYRAVEAREGKVSWAVRQLTETDRNGRLASGAAAQPVNWASRRGNRLTRPVLDRVAGVHRDAALPKFHGKTFVRRARDEAPEVNHAAPAAGRKAIVFATCFVNYNNPSTGVLARRVLARNGVETEVVHPRCCGMPQLERGDIARVASHARGTAAELRPWIERGYDVVALVPSCALMLKFEWPLVLPDDADVGALSAATRDISEYIVDIARNEGLADGLGRLERSVTLHIACHARAQNMGRKAAEMLELIPDADVTVIERCSGHGGSWGVMKDNFEVALKVGRPVAREAWEHRDGFIASECPLAAEHILQGMERLAEGEKVTARGYSPIELLAMAYGLV